MDEGSLEQIRSKTKTTIQSWSETCGLAPEGATDKLVAAMLDWMSDLTLRFHLRLTTKATARRQTQPQCTTMRILNIEWELFAERDAF